MRSQRQNEFFIRTNRREFFAFFPVRNWRGSVCLAVLIWGGLIGISGCGRKTPAATAPSQPNAQDLTQATNLPAVAQPDLPELNRSLRRWLLAHRRPPANFEEFAATAGVTIPPPPPGKKYMIDPKVMQVVLVDR